MIKTIAKYIDTRSKIYKFVIDSSFLGIASFIHKALINTTLFIFSLGRKSSSNYDLSDLTVIIKTFNRPNELKRLVTSIKRFYPELKIIIADDGNQNSNISDVSYFRLPFNSGVSYGRNFALSKVTTPFFLSLDDDFIFYANTKIEESFDVIRNNSEIDLIGGKVVNLPFFRVSSAGGIIYNQTSDDNIERKISSFQVVKKVPQFFIARTEKIKAIGWDEDIKRLDHGVFFSRLNGKVTSVFNPNFTILHARTPFDKDYLEYRLDFEEDLTIINQKYFQSC
jgi:glycosyltransferase involved in cell wall biosynthesis